MKSTSVLAALVAFSGAAQAGFWKAKRMEIPCFDFGDCILSGNWGASCDHSGNNAVAFGILGTCVKSTSSGGGLLASLGLGKRHGPDDDDDMPMPATNATAAPAMAGMVMKKRHGPDDDDDMPAPATNATAAPSMAGMVM